MGLKCSMFRIVALLNGADKFYFEEVIIRIINEFIKDESGIPKPIEELFPGSLSLFKKNNYQDDSFYINLNYYVAKST